MSENWYVWLEDGVKGPLNGAVLVDMVRRGLVTPQVPIRKGKSRWIRAARVKGLFPTDASDEADEPGEVLDFSNLGGVPEAEPTPDDPLQILGLRLDAHEVAAPSAPDESDPDAVAEMPASDLLKIRTEEAEALSGRLRPETEPIRSAKPLPDEALESSDAATRRRYRWLEGSVRSIGLLFYVNALIGVAGGFAWAYRALNRAPTAQDVRAFYLETMLGGFAVVTWTLGMLGLGVGLRGLQAWARWATATVTVESILLALVAELSLAIRGNPRDWPTAVAVLIGGLVVPGVIARVMLAPEAEVVCSTPYREIVRRTRGVRSRFRFYVLALLALEVGAVALVFYAGGGF